MRPEERLLPEDGSSQVLHFLIWALFGPGDLGQLEFFYNQSPESMRSLGSALALLTTSLGSYLSSFLLTLVATFTTRGSKAGWMPDNLNEGHLDYFFWFMAGLSSLNLVVYAFCAIMLNRNRLFKFFPSKKLKGSYFARTLLARKPALHARRNVISYLNALMGSCWRRLECGFS